MDKIEMPNNDQYHLLEHNSCTNILKGKNGYYMYNDKSPIGRSLMFYGEHAENELSYISKFINKGDVVFDIGAHQGTHTLAFSRMVGEEGRVFAFEPQPAMIQILGGTLALNEIYNVISLNKALGYTEKTISIPKLNYKKRGHFSGLKVDDIYEDNNLSIEQTTIDKTIKSFAVKSIDFLKIDTEGMEYFVLLGGLEAITSNRPIVYLEYHEANEYKFEIFRYFKRLNYSVFLHSPIGYNEANFFNYDQDRFNGGKDHNIIAIPNSKVDEFKEMLPSNLKLNLHV